MTRGEQIYNYPLYSLKRFPNFIKYCKPVAKQIGGGKWFSVMMDMIWCNLRYGTMDSRDYLLFEFHKKCSKERKTYFTKRAYFRLIKTFDREVFLRLAEKENQYKEYGQFVNRQWMNIDEMTNWQDLCGFVKQIKDVILKPKSSDCGKGVLKVSSEDSLELLRHIYDNRKAVGYLAEEMVTNCAELDSFNPSSLNTVRVTYVLRRNAEPHIFSVMLRTGASKDSVTDNWGAGGILMNIDLKTGMVVQPGLDEAGNTYLYHPLTKTKIVGFEIPHYHEMLRFAKEVARHNPAVVYGGLDIAITPTGFKLIEVNFPPAYLGYQVFGHGALKHLKMVRR